MLYMVEMDLGPRELLAEFHAWYGGHIRMLLTIPGFISAQRFGGVDADGRAFPRRVLARERRCPSRAGPIATRPDRHPRANGARASGTGTRNLLDGLDAAPEVARTGWLVLTDRLTEAAAPLPPSCVRLRPIGLDRTIVERGFDHGDGEPPAAPSSSADRVTRVLRPLTPIMRATDR